MKTSEYIDGFLSCKNVADTTKITYRKILEKFFRWIHSQGRDPDTLTLKDIIEYFHFLKESQLTSSGLNNNYNVLKCFFNWARDYTKEYDFKNSIMHAMKRPKHDQGFRKYPLNQVEVWQLLKSIDRNTERGLRDYAMISLMLNNLLRRCEISCINLTDFNIRQGKRILFIRRKGRPFKDRFIVLTETVATAINEYLDVRVCFNEEQPLFTSISGFKRGQRLHVNSLSEIIKRRLVAIGLNSRLYSCHSLRHTAACLYLNATNDFHALQLILGHSSPITTQLYTRVLDERRKFENEAGKTLEKLIFSEHKLNKDV